MLEDQRILFMVFAFDYPSTCEKTDPTSFISLSRKKKRKGRREISDTKPREAHGSSQRAVYIQLAEPSQNE